VPDEQNFAERDGRQAAGREGEQHTGREGGRNIPDKLAEEDLLVGVEGVDDEGQELVDVRREGKGLCLCVARHGWKVACLLGSEEEVESKALRCGSCGWLGGEGG